MSAPTTHGGPRRKVRDDDGRGGARAGAGPKVKTAKLKLGDQFFAVQKDSEGRNIDSGQLWTVAELSRKVIRFQSDTGDTFALLR